MQKHARKKKRPVRKAKKLARFSVLNPDAFVPVPRPYFEVEVAGKVELQSDDRVKVVTLVNTFAKAVPVGQVVKVFFVGRTLAGAADASFPFAPTALTQFMPPTGVVRQ